jgi:hypothetical protein
VTTAFSHRPDAREPASAGRRAPAVGALLLVLAVWAGGPLAASEEYCGTYPHRVSTVKQLGGRVDWSWANGLIAYDRPGSDGIYYDVHVMSLDSAKDRCLTCGKHGLVPQRHNGNPAWHPSGNYIVFQSEVADSTATPFESNPGRGVNNVLWVTDPAGREFHQLTELSPSDQVSGVLHPHFSPEGSRLTWSEIYEGAVRTRTAAGHWRLVLADFVVGSDGRPGLQNVQKYELGRPSFYETHGFSPDGSRLIFSSNLAQSGFARINNDIFVLDLDTFALTRLTDRRYNEHAHFFPDGRKIVWMTNANVASRGTDLWIMDDDGSGKERLTFFNKFGCPEFAGPRVAAADNSINAAGDRILVYTHDQVSDFGSIELVELDAPP